MISVAQDNLSLHLVMHIADMAGLHRARSTDRHENRGFDKTMIGVEHTCTCSAFRVVGDNIEIHRSNFVQK